MQTTMVPLEAVAVTGRNLMSAENHASSAGLFFGYAMTTIDALIGDAGRPMQVDVKDW